MNRSPPQELNRKYNGALWGPTDGVGWASPGWRIGQGLVETGVTVERGKQGPLQPLRCFLLKFPYAHGTRTYKLVWKIIVINFVEIERTK